MSRLRNAHEKAGARWSGPAGESAAAEQPPRVRNYGDPAAEYEAARSGVVVAERSDRSFIRVHGRDPVKMVQGLISNDIAGAPASRAVYATVLTPKGKMVADLRVVRRGAELLLETDRAAADGLTAHLRKFVPPLFARFEAADDAWSELGLYGPAAVDVLHKVFGVDAAGVAEDAVVEAALPEAERVRADDEMGASGETPSNATALVVGTSYYGVPGYDLWVPALQAAEVWRALTEAGARPAGHATLDVLRIEAGCPRWGAELTEGTIPLEAGLRERAISETKGCYTGQEVIIRILHRGHVNWKLRRLRLGDVAAPARETPLIDAGTGKQVGRVTSAAWSPRDGEMIGLGYVRREVEPGSSVVRLGSVDGGPVDVVG